MWDFIFGLFIWMGATIVKNTNTAIVQYHEQKTLCEQSLPRNQVCEMKFVPKED